MSFAILPCNGLDKAFGPLARETALCLLAEGGGELICPVLLGNSPDRYAKTLEELPLLVIDGCATRCATKLAHRLQRRISRAIQIAEELKRAGASVEGSLTPGPGELRLAREMAGAVQAGPAPVAAATVTQFPAPAQFIEVVHDKFIFKIPAEGFFFNENDIWVQLSGGRARIGVSDFAQQQMTDITHFGPPAVGTEVEQFGEAGWVESAKATLDLISPVAGRIAAVNGALVDAPEWINQEPYGRGWAVELEMKDFAADRELLVDGPAYATIVRRKAADY